MAFVPGYLKDIFISYAHVDDEPLSGVELGWVTTLKHNIETHLRSKLGNKGAELWMDHEDLVGNRPLSRQIIEALESTAVFLVVVSPGYLDSEWCRKEREKFLELIKERTDADSRVFLIELDKVERSEFPQEFHELVPYYFWSLDRKTKTPKTLGWPEPNPDIHNEYYEELNRLCVVLRDELRRLKSAGAQRLQRQQPAAEATPEEAAEAGKAKEAQGAKAVPTLAESRADSPDAAPAREESPSSPAIYLAEVSDDLKLKRQAVKEYLTSEGFRVLPDNWQSYESLTAFEAALDADLSQCEVFAQLLSEDSGDPDPFGQELSYARLQYDYALRAGKRVLAWRDPKLDMGAVKDKGHSEFLDGPTVLAVGLEEFKRTVRDAASARPEPGPEPGQQEREPGDESEDEDEPYRFVYVYADPMDRARAEALINSDAWDKKIGHVLSTSRQGEDPDFIRKLIKNRLLDLDCVAALVFYGESGPDPVTYQVIQYSKALGNRRKPPLAVAIYDGPPPPPAHNKHDIGLGFPNLRLRMLNCRDGNHRELSEFLRSVKP